MIRNLLSFLPGIPGHVILGMAAALLAGPAPAQGPLRIVIDQSRIEPVPPAMPEPGIVPSGPPLTGGEIDALTFAVFKCWNLGALGSDAARTTVTVFVRMMPDGRPDAGSLRMIESSGGSADGARQAYEAARRAILRCGAEGYDLPAEKYSRWAAIEMVFDPRGMSMR